MAATPQFPDKIISPVAQITDASSAGVAVELVPAQDNGLRLDRVLAYSTEEAAIQVISLYIDDTPVSVIVLPAMTGMDGETPPVDMLSDIGPVMIAPGMSVKVAAAAQLEAGKVVNFIAQGGAY